MDTIEMCDGLNVTERKPPNDSPTSVQSLGLDQDGADLVRKMLDQAHATSRSRPIVGSDTDGVFPSSSSFDILGTAGRRPPIVPDTNLLSRDVGRMCRQPTRTVLVNAANSGAIRLLCPSHVVTEMESHSAEFSEQMRVDEMTYLSTWRQTYLPLLRVIPDLGDDMFTHTETVRLAILHSEDPDDVPAARLAIAAGALFLSDDDAALSAVYGTSRPFDAEANGHKPWVNALKGWGDHQELGNMLEAGALLARLASAATSAGARRAATAPRSSLAIALAALVGAACAIRRATPERRAALRQQAGATGRILLSIVTEHTSASAAMRAQAAPQPTLTAVIASMSTDARLARACIHLLGRHPESIVTASAVSTLLPSTVAKPRGEAKTRHVLRTRETFSQPYRGWFQLGHPTAD